MNNLPDNVRSHLHKLLPHSIIKEISCFVLHDNHPKDKNPIDIAVCTSEGELREYCQRELISSFNINYNLKINDIKIQRNSKCELFYIAFANFAKNEIHILSKKGNQITKHRNFFYIDRWEILDEDCKGFTGIKLFRGDDIIILDENFNSTSNLTPSDCEQLNSNILKELKTKFTEAKYVTKHNENLLKNYVNLRQVAAFSIYKKIQPNLNDTVYKLGVNEISNALQVETQTPLVRCCNKKLVIILSILNKNNVSIDNICVLIHSQVMQSITYSTKVYRQIENPPFWQEKVPQKINSYEEAKVIAVMDLNEMWNNVASSVEFDLVVSYKKDGKKYLLPFESVTISASDTMGANFDILSSDMADSDSHNRILAILSTSIRTDLKLTHIKRTEDMNHDTHSIFCTYLDMEGFIDKRNIIINRKSPYHILFGVMVVVEDNEISDDSTSKIQVYARCSSQVLALLHYLHDKAPYVIIVTTPEFIITALVKKLSQYDQNSDASALHLNYIGLANSVIEQISCIKRYLDDCMVKMAESNKNVDNIGLEIDILAQGLPKYMEFRRNVLKLSIDGIKKITLEKKVTSISDFESAISDAESDISDAEMQIL